MDKKTFLKRLKGKYGIMGITSRNVTGRLAEMLKQISEQR